MKTVQASLTRPLMSLLLASTTILSACSTTGSSSSIPGGSSSASPQAASVDAQLRSMMSRRPRVASTEAWDVLFTAPSSQAAVSAIGIYDWVVVADPSNNNAVSFMGLNRTGSVVWEMDTQSSPQYGIARFWTTSGAYVGMTTAGTVNIAQKFTTQDYTNYQWLDSALDAASHPGTGAAPIRGPISDIARRTHSHHGIHPLAEGGGAWILHAWEAVDGTVGIVGTIAVCVVLEPCGAVGLGVGAAAIILGTGSFVHGVAELISDIQGANAPPSTAGTTTGVTGTASNPFSYTDWSTGPPEYTGPYAIVTIWIPCDCAGGGGYYAEIDYY